MFIQPPTSSLQLVIPSFLLENGIFELLILISGNGSSTEKPIKYRENCKEIDLSTIKQINSSAEQSKLQLQLEKGEFQKQRKELHEQSVKRYKNWDNTVLGERKKRMEDAKDKARRIEEQRQKIDEAWSIVKAEDHRKALARAESLQFNSDPKVRDLNSKLLLMKVIEEREKQIEYKQRKEYLRKQLQPKFNQEAMSISLLMDQGNKWQTTRLKAMEIVREQRQLVAKVTREKQEKKQIDQQATAEKERLELEKHRAEADLVKQEKLEKRHKEIQEFTNNLQQTIQEKLKSKEELKQQEAQLDFSNREFTKYKFQLENRKKQVERERLEEKQQLSEKTSKIQERLNNDHQNKLEEYLNKLASSTGFNPEAKSQLVTEKKKKGMNEQEQYRLFKKEQRLMEETEVQRNRRLDKSRVETEVKAENQEKLEKSRSIQQKEHELAEFRHQQKLEFDKHKHAEKKEAFDHAKQTLNKINEESAVFEQYVSNKIEELGFQNKTHLIVKDFKELNKNKGKNITFPWEDNADTFSRLGFISN